MLLSLFVLLILLGSHLLRVQRKQNDQRPFSETFNRKIEQLLEHFSIPGLAISVVQDDEILARVCTCQHHRRLTLTEHP